MDVRERRIFDAAVAQPAEARDAFVAHACEGDEELEARVRRLLAANDRVPDTASWSPAPATPPAPERIGPYRILEPLGQGGMGAVYLAEQLEPVRRKVALKIVRHGLDTAEVIARFENEQQAMALMSHPHIARILDGGATEEGRPYFVMEYVDGLPIVDYCDRRQMPVAARIALFTQVCHAVRHAHENGVLHRDLKPTNVLVAEAQGRAFPKVIDFGIAKALGDEPGHRTVQTEHGALIGTPAFMSPEQLDAAERLDARSDVYSLGVILYELLAGVMPIDLQQAAGLAAIVHALRYQEPPPPSNAVFRSEAESGRLAAARATTPRELRRALRGDVDAIVMKALERVPARRYASVRELTDDLERVLANEPVRARRATSYYLASRFVRRHRLAVSAGVVVLVSLVLGLITAIWQGNIAASERDRAAAALVESENVSEFLIGLFDRSQDPQTRNAARQILRRGVEQAEAMVGQPAAQAQLLHSLGRAYKNLIEYGPAHDVLMKAYVIRDSLYPAGDPALAWTLFELGLNYEARQLRDSALPMLEAALEMGRAHFGDGTFTGTVLIELGQLALVTGRLDRAEALQLEAAAVWRRVLDPMDPRLAVPLLNLAAIMRKSGDFALATRYHEEAIDHLARVAGPDHISLAPALLQYGDHVLEDLGDARRAIPMFERGLAISEAAYGPDDPRIMHGINSLAVALAEVGEAERAEALVRRGVDIVRSFYGDHHMSTAREREQLANVLLRVGKFEEAERVLRDVIDIKRQILGEATTWTTHRGRSRALVGLGRFEEAATAAQEALAARALVVGGDSAGLATSSLDVGEVYLRSGRYDLAEQWLTAGLDQARKQGERHPVVFMAYEALVRLYEATGEEEKAARYRASADTLGS